MTVYECNVQRMRMDSYSLASESHVSSSADAIVEIRLAVLRFLWSKPDLSIWNDCHLPYRETNLSSLRVLSDKRTTCLFWIQTVLHSQKQRKLPTAHSCLAQMLYEGEVCTDS